MATEVTTKEAVGRLFFIVRKDMASMTTGRIAAQVAHGAHLFCHTVRDIDAVDYNNYNLNSWESEARQGFGTVIVLGVDNLEHMHEVFTKATLSPIKRVVNDDEYPLRDGEMVHIIPDVKTCAYIWVNDITDEEQIAWKEGLQLL